MAQNITDETLMAYVDHELSPAQRQTIEEKLKSDPALRKRLSIYERTGRDLSTAYSQAIQDPIPDNLKDLINNHKNITNKKSLLDTITGFSKDMVQPFLAPAPSIAAATLLVVGIGSGVYLGQQSNDQSDLILAKTDKLYANGVLHKALETLPSEKSISWYAPNGKKGFIVSLHTFISKNKKYCREFETAIPKVTASLGVACRQNNGKWLIKLKVAHAPAPKSVDNFRPASGTGLGSLSSFIDEEMVGKALDFDKETKAIDNGWK